MGKNLFLEFSIDSHPMVWNGRLYLFYSVNNWIGTESKVAGTCILVDELVTPEELAGHPQAVILPSLEQEIYEKNRFGDGRDWYTIEGAAPVIHGNKFWLLYSANAYLNEDYFIGTAVAGCKPELMEMAWTKYPNPYMWHPLLKKSGRVEGTGHNTVTKAPNMVDDWIVYHGRRMEDIRDPLLEQREMYIDPLWFNGREIICFGPTASEQDAPGKPQFQIWNQDVHERTMFSVESAFYYAEFWISAVRQHIGVKFGIYLSWQDERNYLELRLHSGQREMQLLCCTDGICRCVQRKPIELPYDYTVPHLIRVSRCFDEYRVQLDDETVLCFAGSTSFEGVGELGIIPYFSHLILHSLAITESVDLQGESLRHLGKFYNVASAWIDRDGFFSLSGSVELQSEIHEAAFTEEIQLEPCGNENTFLCWCGDLEEASALNKQESYSIYHIVREGKQQFIIDGKKMNWCSVEHRQNDWRLLLKDVKISEYRFTKN